MKFTLYTANCTGNEKNILYPNQKVITSEADLKKAVVYDHVCAQYENFARSDANFLLSDVVPMDCDNDHSDDPKDWITPEMLMNSLGDVAFAVTYSRHHMLTKGNKSARPRFHVFFPTAPCNDANSHKAIKQKIQPHPAKTPRCTRQLKIRFIRNCRSLTEMHWMPHVFSLAVRVMCSGTKAVFPLRTGLH